MYAEVFEARVGGGMKSVSCASNVPMNTISGTVPSSQASSASFRASLIDKALSWPSGVSCLQMGFHSDPSSLISASLATMSIWEDCWGGQSQPHALSSSYH